MTAAVDAAKMKIFDQSISMPFSRLTAVEPCSVFRLLGSNTCESMSQLTRELRQAGQVGLNPREPKRDHLSQARACGRRGLSLRSEVPLRGLTLAVRVGLIDPEARYSRCCRQSFYLRALVTRSLAELRKPLFESSAPG